MGVQFCRLTKNGFTGPKGFRGFRTMSPRTKKKKQRKSNYFVLSYKSKGISQAEISMQKDACVETEINFSLLHDFK